MRAQNFKSPELLGHRRVDFHHGFYQWQFCHPACAGLSAGRGQCAFSWVGVHAVCHGVAYRTLHIPARVAIHQHNE